MAEASVKATMLQVEPQLKEFCEKADFLKMVIKSKTAFREDEAEKLRKLNLSLGIALNDLKQLESAAMKGGTRKRHRKGRKTRRRH